MAPASLHPLPKRPSGPVDPEAAEHHVAAALPQLDGLSGRAFALVALVGRSRADVASDVALEPERLADLLAQARKALRRSMFPLPGSGWCERAERLISDRLDGVMEGSDAGRLEVHLRNCQRCVEHERRLVQATDSLAESFEAASGAPEPRATDEHAGGPALAVVRPTSGPRSLPFGQPVRPAPALPPPEQPEVEPAVARSLLLVLVVLLAVATLALVVAVALGGSLH